jgi:adenylosuccinate lyase
MLELFSDKTKFELWRKIWLALAETQMEIGFTSIRKEHIYELKQFATNINYEVAEAKEKEIRHDIMSHVFAFGQQCPNAEAIIHLGATSCDVVCNAELWQIKHALQFIKEQLVGVLRDLVRFAETHKALVTLGYTHYQPAQSTTIGKRATLYIQDLLFDLDSLEFVEEKILKARGIKGTTGTQATFLQLFDGDEMKVKELDKCVSQKLGFDATYFVTGQTYPRKVDAKVLETLAGIGTSAHKFAVDLRLLSNLQVLEEPFETSQTGSSAMAYKRNPMRSERMTSLARLLFTKPTNAYQTAANQWLERTLDDSAIRRIDIPESFLLADAVLILYANITSNLVVYEKQIAKHLQRELPFLATEEILMRSVAKGKSRQEIHERIKMHSKEVAKKMKLEASENDLFERIAMDNDIPLSHDELTELAQTPSRFTGRAEHQVEEFLSEVVKPKLKRYENIRSIETKVNV